MNSHLRVTIDGHDVVLPADASIDIEQKNPYLNDGIDTYSYSFDLPLEGNRALFGDVDAVQSDIRLNAIEGLPMEIYVDGTLFAHGKVAVVDSQVIADKVSISMTSSKKQLNDLIGDIMLRDLTFPESDRDALQIGEMIGDIEVNRGSYSSYYSKATLSGYYAGELYAIALGSGVTTTAQNSTNTVQLQALGFSAPKEYRTSGSDVAHDTYGNPTVAKDFINVSAAFGDRISHPDGTTRRALYHNARISYIHHRLDTDGKSTDQVLVDETGYGPYFVLEADRPQSGICFYVMYVLEVLFRTRLGLAYDDKVVRSVDDMRRLSFYTTHCKYDLIRRNPGSSPDFGYSEDFEAVNRWLSSRRTGGRLAAGKESNDDANAGGTSYTMTFYPTLYVTHRRLSADEYVELGIQYYNGSLAYFVFGKLSEGRSEVLSSGAEYDVNIVFDDEISLHPEDGRFKVKCRKVELVDNGAKYSYCASVMRMIANADNLPDMSAKSLLDSLWASFGLRFYYNSESNEVEPYYIRDILRSQEPPWQVFGQMLEEHKVSEKITGVRMRYSAEKDRLEQLGDIRRGVTDYDTRYDYLVDMTPPARFETGQDFMTFSRGTISVGDMRLYVDQNTGNVFRIKINKEELSAGNMQSLQPSVFQVAQWKGITVMAPEYEQMSDVELTDPDIADYVQDLTSEFEPLVQNDINAKRPLKTALLAPFTDEEMWNEHAGMPAIRNVVDSNEAFIHYIDEALETQERYDPTQTDDGNSPLQTIDWGSTVTLMRGGGSDAKINHFARNYDHFDDERWRTVSGTYAMDSDSISLYGEHYDYNGSGEVITTRSAARASARAAGRYDGTYTRAEAKQLVAQIWPSSNADLLSPFREVEASKVIAAGWPASQVGNGFCTVFSGSRALTDYDGVIREFLYTPISDMGDVMSPTELQSYLSRLEQAAAQLSRPVIALDAESDRDLINAFGIGRHIIIQQFDDVSSPDYHSVWADYYASLLHQLHDIIYGDADEVICPEPGSSSGDDTGSGDAGGSTGGGSSSGSGGSGNGYGGGERISLAIRAYHNAPADLPGGIKKGQMLCHDKAIARRGLADTFMSEYIYFLLHRKPVQVKMLCEVSYLVNIPWKRRFRIGDNIGWVDKISTKISVEKGIEEVEFSLFVL